ncbi:MAG: hypothetical protein K6E94_00635 [Elusimicrobiaceae bacterium]|nr:hypothetical protein [Elusimicrobiaceae bacterium]
MGKYLSGKQLQQALFKRTEGYAANVRAIYNDSLGKIIDIVKGTELENGVPFSFSEYGYTDEVQPILRNMYSRVYQAIRTGVQKEWLFASENNDELVKSVFGDSSIEDNHFAKYFLRNREAMDAFFARKTQGMDLSQKVWKYTSQYKGELEGTLDLAIGEGTPANQLASKIQQYLQDPDRWYRRFRVKIGEDEDGNPIYGRIWKRRIFDKEDGIYKWINDDPKHYHPGQGVYRSSYRNAQRLARSETNIAYRSADFERWQQLDFVVGVEIKLSNNHPELDICDQLKGIYPKDFKWTGWHPNCRCYMVPVLATDQELDDMVDRILSGEEPGNLSVESSNEVTEAPESFKKWLEDPKTQERMEKAEAKGTLPYFIRDNKDLVNIILKPPTPEELHHQALVKQYGEEAVQKLYDAFDAFKLKISTGDLAFQAKKLKFEANWVADKNKFATSQEMAKMLLDELAKVEKKLEIQTATNEAQTVLSFKSKSKPLKDLQKQIQEAIAQGEDAALIRDLTGKAAIRIQELEKARLKKLVAQGGDGSTIDLFATAEEKLEIARLQAVYDDLLAKHGSQWQSDVNYAYRQLADYKKELAKKYHSHQGKILKLNGETEESAAKALQEYLDATPNTSAMTEVGGKFHLKSSERYAMEQFSKQYGIPVEELGLINRYSYGSKWINRYSYGVIDSYHGVVEDYGGLCPKFIQACNAALEKMPRYQGTVFSGVSFDSALLDKQIQTLQECLKTGQPYVNKALMSSTTNIEKTTIFGDNFMYVIKSKHGADIKPISHYASEDEIVFRAGAKFKVTKVYQETSRQFGFGQGWVVEMEEI